MTEPRTIHLRDVRFFFFVLLAFWILSAILLFSKGYHGSFRFLNQYQEEHVGYASLYFFTHLGDGVILPMMLVLFMWRKDPALVISGVIAMLATGLLTQLFKILLFDDWMRPPSVFEGDTSVHIFHPRPAKRHSFPSGHATSLAVGGLVFAWFWDHKSAWLQVAVGLFTVALCYTRVILGVHFPGDIFAGSVIGFWGCFGILLAVYPPLHRWGKKLRVKERKWVAVTVMVLTLSGGVFQYFKLIGRL